MGPIGDDRLDDVDRLLEELIPDDSSDDGIAHWHGTEVRNDAVASTVGAHSISPAVPQVAAPVITVDTPDDIESPPRSSGRRWLGAVAAGAAIVVAGAIGYVLAISGSERGAESATDDDLPQNSAPAAEESTTTAVAPSTTAASDGPPASVEAERLAAQLVATDLSSIAFAPGNDQPTEEGRLAISELAQVLLANPGVPVQVQVATFDQATLEENHGLSTRRARSVVDALIAEGVEPGRLAFAGRGGSPEMVDELGAMVFETDDDDLAATLAGIGVTSPALDASGSLSDEMRRTLDLVAAAMAAQPDSTLTLLAHVDGGSAQGSHDLSHSILDEVVDELGALGVEPARLTTVGMGQAPLTTDQRPAVSVATGPTASMAVALAAIDTARIAFEPGTNVLTADGVAIVADVASVLAADPSIDVAVFAHSFTEQTAAQNHDLSHDQGDAVVAALVAAGVSPDRLAVTGHGGPQSLAAPGRDALITFDLVD